MSATIEAIHGAVVGNERKARFLEHLAKAFDRYVAEYGVEPEAIVFVQGGIKQTATPGYITTGETSEGVASMLALALAALTREIVLPDKEP